jgi:HK97 family phage portal protein
VNWLQKIAGMPKLERELQQVKALALSQASQREVNNSVTYFASWDVFNGNDRFLTNADVYAVISKIAVTCARLPMYVYEVKPDVQEKDVKRIQSLHKGQYIDGAAAFALKAANIKALAPIEGTDLAEVLLNKPNAYQSRTEFLENIYHWRVRKGEWFVYKNRLGMGANAGTVKELYVLNPMYVGIKATLTYPREITGYTYNVPGMGITLNIDPEDMIHGKTFNPEDDLRGLDPLRPGAVNIQRGEAAENQSVKQLQNGGIPAIVYNEDVGSDEVGQPELDAARNAYESFSSNSNNKGKVYFMAGRIGVAQTGSSVADLNVLETERYSFKKLCNQFGVSDILFNSDAASARENVNQKQKELYTVVCLPIAYSVADKLNKELLMEFTDKKRMIDIDLSGVSELQQDLQKTALTLSEMPITPSGNEMRAMFNFEPSDAANMDEPLIKTGYEPISFLTQPEPVIVP